VDQEEIRRRMAKVRAAKQRAKEAAINERMAKVRAAKRQQQLIQQDTVQVRLLRDQPIACTHCGELFNAGDIVLMPRATAEGLVQIGDAVLVQTTE